MNSLHSSFGSHDSLSRERRELKFAEAMQPWEIAETKEKELNDLAARDAEKRRGAAGKVAAGINLIRPIGALADEAPKEDVRWKNAFSNRRAIAELAGETDQLDKAEALMRISQADDADIDDLRIAFRQGRWQVWQGDPGFVEDAAGIIERRIKNMQEDGTEGSVLREKFPKQPGEPAEEYEARIAAIQANMPRLSAQDKQSAARKWGELLGTMKERQGRQASVDGLIDRQRKDPQVIREWTAEQIKQNGPLYIQQLTLAAAQDYTVMRDVTERFVKAADRVAIIEQVFQKQPRIVLYYPEELRRTPEYRALMTEAATLDGFVLAIVNRESWLWKKEDYTPLAKNAVKKTPSAVHYGIKAENPAEFSGFIQGLDLSVSIAMLAETDGNLIEGTGGIQWNKGINTFDAYQSEKNGQGFTALVKDVFEKVKSDANPRIKADFVKAILRNRYLSGEFEKSDAKTHKEVIDLGITLLSGFPDLKEILPAIAAGKIEKKNITPDFIKASPNGLFFENGELHETIYGLMEKDGTLLQYAPDAWKKTEWLVLRLLNNGKDAAAYRFASPEVKNSPLVRYVALKKKANAATFAQTDDFPEGHKRETTGDIAKQMTPDVLRAMIESEHFSPTDDVLISMAEDKSLPRESAILLLKTYIKKDPKLLGRAVHANPELATLDIVTEIMPRDNRILDYADRFMNIPDGAGKMTNQTLEGALIGVDAKSLAEDPKKEQLRRVNGQYLNLMEAYLDSEGVSKFEVDESTGKETARPKESIRRLARNPALAQPEHQEMALQLVKLSAGLFDDLPPELKDKENKVRGEFFRRAVAANPEVFHLLLSKEIGLDPAQKHELAELAFIGKPELLESVPDIKAEMAKEMTEAKTLIGLVRKNPAVFRYLPECLGITKATPANDPLHQKYLQLAIAANVDRFTAINLPTMMPESVRGDSAFYRACDNQNAPWVLRFAPRLVALALVREKGSRFRWISAELQRDNEIRDAVMPGILNEMDRAERERILNAAKTAAEARERQQSAPEGVSAALDTLWKEMTRVRASVLPRLKPKSGSSNPEKLDAQDHVEQYLKQIQEHFANAANAPKFSVEQVNVYIGVMNKLQKDVIKPALTAEAITPAILKVPYVQNSAVIERQVLPEETHGKPKPTELVKPASQELMVLSANVEEMVRRMPVYHRTEEEWAKWLKSPANKTAMDAFEKSSAEILTPVTNRLLAMAKDPAVKAQERQALAATLFPLRAALAIPTWDLRSIERFISNQELKDAFNYVQGLE